MKWENDAHGPFTVSKEWIFFFDGSREWPRASHTLGKCSITGAMPLLVFVVVVCLFVVAVTGSHCVCLTNLELTIHLRVAGIQAHATTCSWYSWKKIYVTKSGKYMCLTWLHLSECAQLLGGGRSNFCLSTREFTFCLTWRTNAPEGREVAMRVCFPSGSFRRPPHAVSSSRIETYSFLSQCGPHLWKAIMCTYSILLQYFHGHFHMCSFHGCADFRTHPSTS
jgi:hypothetical protein